MAAARSVASDRDCRTARLVVFDINLVVVHIPGNFDNQMMARHSAEAEKA
jgi:hypothetical protein